jgi:hypothetical protein
VMESIMKQDEKQIVVTLAAAIVIARGAKSVAEVREAWVDAGWILAPASTRPEYKAWQEKHGEVPTTAEQDQQRAEKRSQKMRETIRKMA